MKAFFFSLLFSLQLFACALCSMYTPSAHVAINMDIDETTIKTADIEWRFTGEFTKTLLPQYDHDSDGKFDDKEMKAVESALLDYIKPLDFLTTVKYHDKETEQTFSEVADQKIDVDAYTVWMKEEEIYLNYRLKFDYALKNGYVLFIGIFDNGGFMNFLIAPNGVTFEMPAERYISANSNMNMVYFEIMAEAPKAEENITVAQPVESRIAAENSAPEAIAMTNSYIDFLSRLLADISDEVKSYLLEIKNAQSSVAFVSLMVFSFLYGFVHAAGPGHGKALVSSYFLASQKDIKKAAKISFLIGVVHTFSALILTLAVYFVLNVLLSTFMNDVTFYLTKVSAVIIIIIALYLLYKKLPKKPKGMQWQTHAPTCGCASCKVDEKSSDLGIILSAGMVPCPGTVLIFIFTISLGMYFTGFMSALLMSLGMSVVIFTAAALSVGIRNKLDQKYHKLTELLSYTGLVIILLLGISMLFV